MILVAVWVDLDSTARSSWPHSLIETVLILCFREAARVEDETVDGGEDDGESSAGTEGDGTKCWRRSRSRSARRGASGSGSDVDEVRCHTKACMHATLCCQSMLKLVASSLPRHRYSKSTMKISRSQSQNQRRP